MLSICPAQISNTIEQGLAESPFVRTEQPQVFSHMSEKFCEVVGEEFSVIRPGPAPFVSYIDSSRDKIVHLDVDHFQSMTFPSLHVKNCFALIWTPCARFLFALTTDNMIYVYNFFNWRFSFCCSTDFEFTDFETFPTLLDDDRYVVIMQGEMQKLFVRRLFSNNSITAFFDGERSLCVSRTEGMPPPPLSHLLIPIGNVRTICLDGDSVRVEKDDGVTVFTIDTDSMKFSVSKEPQAVSLVDVELPFLPDENITSLAHHEGITLYTRQSMNEHGVTNTEFVIRDGETDELLHTRRMDENARIFHVFSSTPRVGIHVDRGNVEYIYPHTLVERHLRRIAALDMSRMMVEAERYRYEPKGLFAFFESDESFVEAIIDNEWPLDSLAEFFLQLSKEMQTLAVLVPPPDLETFGKDESVSRLCLKLLFIWYNNSTFHTLPEYLSHVSRAQLAEVCDFLILSFISAECLVFICNVFHSKALSRRVSSLVRLDQRVFRRITESDKVSTAMRLLPPRVAVVLRFVVNERKGAPTNIALADLPLLLGLLKTQQLFESDDKFTQFRPWLERLDAWVPLDKALRNVVVEEVNEEPIEFEYTHIVKELKAISTLLKKGPGFIIRITRLEKMYDTYFKGMNEGISEAKLNSMRKRLQGEANSFHEAFSIYKDMEERLERAPQLVLALCLSDVDVACAYAEEIITRLTTVLKKDESRLLFKKKFDPIDYTLYKHVFLVVDSCIVPGPTKSPLQYFLH
ncbi:hypothetical protein PCE1_000339 [Barthelona sp. PCE]